MKIDISIALHDGYQTNANMTAYNIHYKEDVDRLVKISAGLNGIFADFKKPTVQEKPKEKA